jgi:site-specific recombinase XerD
MVEVSLESGGPLSSWAGPLVIWLRDRGVCLERSARTVRTFARFSSWMAARELSLADLDEDLVDEYVEAERRRSGSKVPAAFQYLPLVKRFFADQALMVLRGPVSRDRDGLPRLLVGPLSGSILDLVTWLKAEGYARGTASSVACTAARLSAWMATEGLGVERLDDALLSRFVAAQSQGPVRHPSSARRIVTVRRFLLATGLVTEIVSWVVAPAATPAQECLEEWAQYLRRERGLAPATIREYQRWAAPFVTELAGPAGSIRWDQIEARRVNRYVTEQGRGYALASRRHLVTALRSLLTWAWLTAQLDRPMAGMVLRPPIRRANLPRALGSGQVEAIEAAADTTAPIGLRDYAVVVLIARLGVRAGEVASLGLDDLDWHRGRLVVRGKGGRVLTLPLPVDVGQALVAYLRDGRPAGAADRTVFLRVRPPLVGLSSKGISGVVARLAERAGLGTVYAHRLRHTTATQVLAHGGSLMEARELLGHARSDTTMIYAKTDLAALVALVTPWGRMPGASS